MDDVIQRYLVIASDTVPNVPHKWEEFLLWLKLSTGELFKWAGSEWVSAFRPLEQSELQEAVDALSSVYAVIAHGHPTLGDINFTGTISADGEAGVTGSRVIDGHRLTFKNGILVGYEAP